ncbi:MAG TPA: hypothetical protein IAB62_12280 [Candidatus Coprocola pullicola]|nr:hypothetical protein [Candidatus Coprocola pullicola]
MLSFIVHDTKEFMNLLLKQTAFDSFELRQMDITTFALFQIDGLRNKSYFPLAEQELFAGKYCLWKEIRPFAFEIIKGQKLPKSIKIIFSMPENKKELVCAVSATYFLNITFSQNILTCTTGCSPKIFSLDKTAEHAWDEWIISFFQKLKIAVIKQS